VKVTVDASFDADSLRGTTGAVIHDSSGKFVAENKYKFDFVQDVSTTEAYTLKSGLLLAQSLGCNPVILSSGIFFPVASKIATWKNAFSFTKNLSHRYRKQQVIEPMLRSVK
jgi:hypothetical protein